MAQPSRLALLPGYDTAPDIYESAETATSPTNTANTQRTSPGSPSDTDSTSNSEEDDEDDEESYGISRRRLYPERARQRFRDGAGRVEARGVDLSDRVDGGRKGYGVRRQSSRGRNEDEDEGLEARIARLRREVEECRLEAEKEKAKEEDGEEEGEDGMEAVDGLSRLLSSIEVPASNTKRRSAREANGTLQPAPDEPDLTDDQTLSRVADFDTRLAALEAALGLSSLDAPPEQSHTPLLPSLTLLDHQLSALSTASTLSGLESARSRIQKLHTDANALSPTHPTSSEDTPALSEEDTQHLQNLYTLLPTLHSLAPTVPALLARLRSLRTLHTTASTAATDLEAVEKRQSKMEADIKAWREGLEKVEAAVQQASEANGRNGGFVKQWIEELQGRVGKLGR